MTWSDWLRIYSLEVAKTFPGAPGAFISQHILALAEHARVLGATDPESHERLAQAEADREAAWIQALEHEAMAPGVWNLTEHHPDEVGGWDGCPADDGARRAWLANDPDDETWCN